MRAGLLYVALCPSLATLALATPATARPVCTPTEERGSARPQLSGPEETLLTPDGRFTLRFTREGQDRPTALDDLDGNARADVLDRVIEGLTLGEEQFPSGGWRAGAPDDGEGGDASIDVYLRSIDANGYAFHAPAEAGSDAASSCTIHLESSLGDSLEGILESVAAHELHHCVQYAYTTLAPSWLLEATATYEQYRLVSSPALAAALEVLWIARLSSPEQSLDALDGRYEYAGFVFPFFWESFGAPMRGRAALLWEAQRAAEGDWQAGLDAASEDAFGQPFARTFLDYATWNAFACARDDGAHYDRTLYPCTITSTEVPIASPAPEALAINLDATPYAASYAAWPAEGDERPVRLQCEGPGGLGARARLRLLALDRWGRATEEADVAAGDDEAFVLELLGAQDAAGQTMVVVASVGTAPVMLRCVVSRTALPVEPPGDDPMSDGDGCPTACAGTSAALFPAVLVSGTRRRRRPWG